MGAFIDEGGNNFWGVEVWHDETGRRYVLLASDKDFGLYTSHPGQPLTPGASIPPGTPSPGSSG
ncbi:MAG TPA: hypothetical protein VHH09_03685 [Acidimicrobiales bacterium]|nr:hypothetical protein [Acidimicrobiales bacterium]